MTDNLDPGEILKLCAAMLWQLARQIAAHSPRAPYPHLVKQLEEIARQKQRMVDILKGELSHLGKDFGQPRLAIKPGKNHWERMRQDVEDQKTLEDDFLTYAADLAETAPTISGLLEDLVAQQGSHLEALLNMLIRADPQADQT